MRGLLSALGELKSAGARGVLLREPELTDAELLELAERTRAGVWAAAFCAAPPARPLAPQSWFGGVASPRTGKREGLGVVQEGGELDMLV